MSKDIQIELSTFKGLEVIRQQFEEYKQKFILEAKEKLTESFKEVFEKYPEIESIKWQQYTPYFNDGEPCTFRVGDCTYTFVGMDNEDFELQGCISELDIKDAPELSKYLFLNPVLKIINKNIGSAAFEEVMQEMFGDHVEVAVTKEGIQVDEYDHD